MLLQLLVEVVNNGWYDANGIISKHSSGFGWDPVTKKFIARDRSIRKKTFADYEDLMTVFGDGTAKGNNSNGLGDDTDVTTYRVEESRPFRVDEFPPFYENVEQLDPLCQTPSHASSFLDANFEDPTAAIATEIQGIHKMEKKEEEKNNNVWDAIKATPNLDAPSCYKAVALVQKLGMKKEFFKMTPEERSEWIKYNME
ncbi:hypothetical protein D8674_014012 [Pyrus ussuriensis x Pyrus communis]|uniref:At2g29880-like C-terminal domain-containing protein n=1 Tax=Pyrus ussuriensis x Pyrus communis TaxID=2448454 RepID=A0A5N5GU18_9ROSA|nr:hypothetical protein D8674_014012 [Pyrus ussuriensis x Pyrus communis]